MNFDLTGFKNNSWFKKVNQSRVPPKTIWNERKNLV